MANWPTPSELVNTGVSIVLKLFLNKGKIFLFQHAEFISNVENYINKEVLKT